MHGLKRLQGVVSSEISELTATVYVEGASENTYDHTRILHPFTEARIAHPQPRRGVVTLMDEDLLDWNLFLDRTSPSTALLLSVSIC